MSPGSRAFAALRGAARVAGLAAAVAAGGCIERSTLAPPPPPSQPATPPESRTAEPNGPAKLHLRDGRLVVLEAWGVVGPSVRGYGRTYGVERDLVQQGAVEVPLADVVLVETTQKKPDPALLPLALVTGASVALTVYCLANIKACFGSCPTFYVPDSRGGWTLQAEGFSSSIARIFEADDLDDLPDARPVDGAITVAMRNEALETHMVRAVSLRVVHGPAGSAVYRAFGDGYLAVGPAVAPDACDGDGVCDALAAKDGREVAMESDGEDLAARTSLTARYPAPGRRDVALVLTARNSLMSTYVLYTMMALHGGAVGELMAKVERGDPRSIAGLVGFDAALGGVDVAFRQKGAPFRRAGRLGYIGPIARATRALAFSVDDPSAPVEVQLSFARAHWKIDAARLAPVVAPGLDAADVPAEVASASAGDGRPALRDTAAIAASLRGEGPYVVTTPGDVVVLRFPVAPPPPGASTGYFLHSRGYYYEWMRDEWAREEDLERAHRYMEDPARALRELAPTYRAVEPSMESVFRASRFARPSP
jgi:hypothetical protein